MVKLPRQSLLTPVALAAIVVWIFWLRWPSFPYAFWNLDEGIYATVGRTVLDGGVMYRDVIDHRGPVCHYATAAIFAVAGVNNVWAMHAVLAGMVVAIALAAFVIGRQARDTVTGLWAAAIFAALSTDLFYVGDAYSVSTEWFLILFSSGGAMIFWLTWRRDAFWLPAASGACYALALLSKAPGAAEFGAPLGLAVYAGLTRRVPWRQAARLLGGLVTGFTAVLALVYLYFWLHGAQREYFFYNWTYNLTYYGANTSALDRLLAAIAFPRMLAEEYPALLAAALLTGLIGVHALSRDVPSERARAAQPAAAFMLLWLAVSLTGAASAGRVHAHYYIQALPALTLAAAWPLGGLTCWASAPARRWRWWVAAPFLGAVAWVLVAHPLRGRARGDMGRDLAYQVAEFVRAHSQTSDRIIVWGLYPDMYAYADRQPGSRYIYTSFQTGVQPGKNTAPGIDTEYGVVPGALDVLIRDLIASRPLFFIDSSLGTQRLFEKYPLSRNPRLAEYVRTNYVEVEPDRFHPHGFRVMMRRDELRAAPIPLAGGVTGQPLDLPALNGIAVTDPIPRDYRLFARHPGGRLQRLELLINGRSAASVSFPPTAEMSVIIPVDFRALGVGTYLLEARATLASGESRASAPLQVVCADTLPADRLQGFALRTINAGPPAILVRSPFGAGIEHENGATIYFAHAPSEIRYELPPGSRSLSGRFAIRPAAYADDNPGRTDGAEFVITWITPANRRVELFRRLLRPREVPADRGEQPFMVQLPAHHQGGTLELAINEGPARSAASDWTYWTDLLLIDADRGPSRSVGAPETH